MTWEDIIKEDELEKSDDVWGGYMYDSGAEQIPLTPELAIGIIMAQFAIYGIGFYMADEDFRNGTHGALKKLLAKLAKAPKDIRDKIKQAMKKAE